MADEWRQLSDADLRNHIEQSRKAVTVMEAELNARHRPVAVMVPLSLLLRVRSALVQTGLSLGTVSYADREALAIIVNAAINNPQRGGS